MTDMAGLDLYREVDDEDKYREGFQKYAIYAHIFEQRKELYCNDSFEGNLSKAI